MIKKLPLKYSCMVFRDLTGQVHQRMLFGFHLTPPRRRGRDPGRMLTIGSLFSGIGGLEIGLEQAGLGPVLWQVEIDEYCRRVLARHWPDVPRYPDIREFPNDNTARPDIICGGFPCQPFSTASRGRKTASDYWPEMLRVVNTMRPTIVICENVSVSAIHKAKEDLDALEYKTISFCLGAHAIGADHKRNRRWCVAYANHQSELHSTFHAKVEVVPSIRENLWGWRAFARTCGVSDGIPTRMDPSRRQRLKALGNAVVPACARWIGERIILRGESNDRLPPGVSRQGEERFY